MDALVSIRENCNTWVKLKRDFLVCSWSIQRMWHFSLERSFCKHCFGSGSFCQWHWRDSILETNALLRGEHGWAVVSASTGERWRSKLELNGQAAWAGRGGCPGAWRIFSLLLRGVRLNHQLFQVARIPSWRVITSPRWIAFLLTTPFFLQMGLPMELLF